jgi:hypothetical protein
MEYGVETPSI